jgi:hypothetical protein
MKIAESAAGAKTLIVRGMDPRIRIRTKMSRIRNNGRSEGQKRT